MRHYGMPLSQVRERVLLWEFAAMAAHLPRESATLEAIDPEGVAWDLHAQLQAASVDTLRWLQWAKTKDGEKGRNRPKPIPRPGVEPSEKVTRKIGSGSMQLNELRDWLGWTTPKEAPAGRPRDARGRFVKCDA